ncbi:MAG: PAS domain S-box protein, partial [Gemmatimonadales bacterium]
MTPFGTLVALAGAEAFLGLLFATLFFRLSRIYRRADLRFWTRAWISLLLHLAAVVVDDLLGRAGFGPGNPLRALSVAAYVATSTVAMVWLGLGAATFVSSLNPSRGMVRQVVGAAIAFGAMVGAAIWFLPIPADRVEFVREGLRAGVAAVIAAAVAAYTWHHGQRGSEGALLTKLGLTGLAVSQLHYAVVATLYRGEQGLTWPIAYFAVGDVLVWVLLGLGAIFWLLEQERAKVAEGALVRAELESDLRRRDLRFEAIVNGVQDLIIVLDATGKVTFSGHRESPVTRFTAEEVVGTSLEWHVHPEDLGQVRRAFGAALARPRETVSMLCRVRTRAGGWVTLECVAQNRLDEPGIQGILVTARDVTERLRLEAELEHAKRMESIGRLAGGVAHDFNNLLTVITGNASLGRDRLEPGAPGYRELTEVETAAAKAAALTRQLLSFARRQVVEPRTEDL